MVSIIRQGAVTSDLLSLVLAEHVLTPVSRRF